MKIMSVEAFDNMTERAMKYVYTKKHGYMKELKPFGEEVVSSMKLAGFLKTGWTEKEETFGMTNALKRYVEVVFGKIGLKDKISILTQQKNSN